MEPKEKEEEIYWNQIKKRDNPNFWMTDPYVKYKRLVFVQEDTLLGYKEDVNLNEWFFCPFDIRKDSFDLNQNVFCGFPNQKNCLGNSIFLDYQYIYDSKNFKDLSGNKWQVFRKNSKKYRRRFEGNFDYRLLKEGEREEEIENLILGWSEKEKEIYDSEVMIDYLFFSDFRWGLFTNGKLIGINVAEENWKYIYFRFCLDDGTSFLNEYLRLLFYENVEFVFDKNKLVNDGGDLGNEGLAFYKKKLNPVRIDSIFGYRKE